MKTRTQVPFFGIATVFKGATHRQSHRRLSVDFWLRGRIRQVLPCLFFLAAIPNPCDSGTHNCSVHADCTHTGRLSFNCSCKDTYVGDGTTCRCKNSNAGICSKLPYLRKLPFLLLFFDSHEALSVYNSSAFAAFPNSCAVIAEIFVLVHDLSSHVLYVWLKA